jgi:hypothetical protein
MSEVQQYINQLKARILDTQDSAHAINNTLNDVFSVAGVTTAEELKVVLEESFPQTIEGDSK